MLKIVAVVAFAVCVLAQQPPPPPFLQNAGAAKQAEFQQLLASAGGLTDAQIDQKVEGWISKQDASIKSAFAAFQAQVKAAQAQGEAAHKAAIAKFSPAAKAADAKLSAIANNPSLSAEAKGQQIDALLGSLPASVRNEIQSAMQG